MVRIRRWKKKITLRFRSSCWRRQEASDSPFGTLTRDRGFYNGAWGAQRTGHQDNALTVPAAYRRPISSAQPPVGRQGGREEGCVCEKGGVDGGWQRALEPDVINTAHQVKSDTLPPTYGPFLWKRWPMRLDDFHPSISQTDSVFHTRVMILLKLELFSRVC